MESLNGRIAVVTGASKGLGRSIAVKLAQAGAKVALVARSREALEALAAEIGNGARAFPCDLRSPDSIRAVFAEIAAHYGRIDTLVNNAVMCLLNPIDDVSDEDVRCEVETNFMAPIFCIRAVVPFMRAQGGGEIMNITSDSVGTPFPMLTIYAATKGALETLSLGLRTELKPDNIRVITFRSGYMEETSSQALWSEERRAQFYKVLQTTGLGHYAGEGVPSDMQADAVVAVLALPHRANVEHITVRSTQ
ncbi:SDR family NAD(P)-dependent oxidoreductase [Sphingobium phenoxybenzoativorans]|uniref:SDR family NAD(P)-dependent oxidoreductase n=1 Tax=Sphingobium phenoxybenzoativorans TaxID=1592790 RepID=A0A975Q278_9SPHN|nr:SDR family NAD(P)-dependent oxidoreductase [Sphingobium phenoxybenzoativorans]QUT06715.1 SDR family NAD(P)-dependent oxidoreductase [Sphingobium phenoxybenzoativorans]